MNDPKDTLDELRGQALQEVLDFFQGDHEAMEYWLSCEVRGLGFITPKEALKTNSGIERLRVLIHRLERGIPT